MKQHSYEVKAKWTGNDGSGTSTYKSYRRDHEILVVGKATIPASSDPAFRGDRTRYNPEELLVASLSSCHMLWYLHLCAVSHVVVTSYEDSASGVMEERPDGSGAFVRVRLRPSISISAESDLEKAVSLHNEAHRMCFIANSVNFPVEIEPNVSSQ